MNAGITENEQKAILTLTLMAAFADGRKDEAEREEIRRIADALAGEAPINLAGLYQDVLLRRVSVATAAAALGSPEARQLAFELAVCVCDADGVQSPAEQAFLGDLRRALALDEERSAGYARQADEIAAAAPAAGSASVAAVAWGNTADDGRQPTASVDELPQAARETTAYASTMSESELDRTILNAAILNGALELLPESLSTMAIIPLQMKLVYRIGQSYGFHLDRGHIKDFLATLGVGLTSQYLEQAGRKLLGGLLGKLGGGLLGGIGKQAVSSGMSFASTYALGHVARRYYAGGRSLSTQVLRQAFDDLLGEARNLQHGYLPQMQEKARSLAGSNIAELVKRW